MNKKYLVYGDTWFEGYGAKITIFGVFDTLEQAKEAKKEKEEEYFYSSSSFLSFFVTTVSLS